MPSVRLLSIVHQFFKPGAAKGTLKWVPWQLRMPQHQYQEIMEARTTRTLRTEAQLISNALFDETPQLNINNASPSPPWLGRTQQVFRNAICLCGGAHLHNLKALDKKVFDLCTQQLHPKTGLRTVNTAELLQADRKIWAELIALHSDGWPLDEALHELTKIRADVHTSLQPRPKPAQPASKGTGKGKGEDKTKTKTWQARTEHLKDDKEAAQLAAAMKNLALSHSSKTFCLRYNRQACTNKQCKLLHVCAIKLPNGNACVA